MTLERLQWIAALHARQRADRHRKALSALVETTLGVTLAPWQLSILERLTERPRPR